MAVLTLAPIAVLAPMMHAKKYDRVKFAHVLWVSITKNVAASF